MVATLAAFPARSLPRPHAGPAPSRRYERRRPEKTPLYKIVAECLEGWLADRSAREQPVAGYVEEEFREYLTCGLLCFGFARALCTRCPQRFVVAFSCKRRGVCPSCNGRHMAQTAAHESPRSRGPAESSSSRRLSFWTGLRKDRTVNGTFASDGRVIAGR